MTDWRILIGVIALAALGGWLLARDPDPPERREPTGVRHEGAVRASPPPARPAVQPVHPAPLGPAGEERAAAEIDGALAGLSAALTADRRIEDLIFPRTVGTDVPMTLMYTRPARFWQRGLSRGVLR